MSQRRHHRARYHAARRAAVSRLRQDRRDAAAMCDEEGAAIPLIDGSVFAFDVVFVSPARPLLRCLRSADVLPELSSPAA